MIRTLLIANRGEIARRIIRTARAMGIRTVAVYSEPDANSPHVAEADGAAALGGRSSAESYLDVSKLLAVAHRCDADAVHPGYGFVSERADAARAFVDAGLIWVGPPPEVIAALGDKVRAKELMSAAGVPLLPGANLAEGSRPEAWLDAASGVGYPLLVKAAAGGGGRGMRLVEDAASLADAVEGASREAQSAFGNGAVFLERWLPAPRHVEVQIIADQRGRVLHLGDRDCSIQRRHQKIVEEAPASGLSDSVREGLRRAAVDGATAVGYVGAGTWEFLVDGDEFAFLEVNTRLQVEHPVTEQITGLDLVRLQLQIAGGQPLDLRQEDISFDGHAIEVRVVAEDPARDWLPSSGPLHRFGAAEPVVDGVRFELGASSGSVVTPDYDSLLGKIIGSGGSRPEAVARLRAAVQGLEIHGLRTNRELLVSLLDEADFRAGGATVAYLPAHPDLQNAGTDAELTGTHALAAALWTAADRRRAATVLPAVPSGWRNLPSADQRCDWHHNGTTVSVTYRLSGDAGAGGGFAPGRLRSGEFVGRVDGRGVAGRIFSVDAGRIDLEVDGIRFVCRCERVGDSVWVGSADGQTTFDEVPRFVDPAATATGGRGPTAPVPGTVISVEVSPGQAITAGDTLVVLEAMKLEHRIRASAPGTVTAVLVAAGDKVDAHQVLVTVQSP